MSRCIDNFNECHRQMSQEEVKLNISIVDKTKQPFDRSKKLAKIKRITNLKKPQEQPKEEEEDPKEEEEDPKEEEEDPKEEEEEDPKEEEEEDPKEEEEEDPKEEEEDPKEDEEEEQPKEVQEEQPKEDDDFREIDIEIDISKKPKKRDGSVIIKKKRKKIITTKSLKKTITGEPSPDDLPDEPVEESKQQKIVIKKRKKIVKKVLPDVDESKMIIGDVPLSERLWPKEEPINIKAPNYYMNNRKIFINFIDSLFEKYRDDLEEESKDLSCDRGPGAFSLMTHQSIVRDYMNLYTPYRGLLVYHGLGAGKTCSSISIAEGMKHDKGVIIMTPASLRQNYITELKTCGDTLYRLNQYWEFISIDEEPELEEKLKNILHLPRGFIKKQRGAWMINIKKQPNYDTLSTPEKESLNIQLDYMIKAKYQFINYNGLRMRHLEELTDGNTKNPFDNKVVIIDEAHNFVSRIVNKIKKVDTLSHKMYKYIMDATNCKIIFLTGTPIINYPNEIGIMYNMLRGYIKTFTFYVNVQTKERVTQETVENIISQVEVSDYVKYNASSKTITVTRNPFGFVSVRDKKDYMGVRTYKTMNAKNKKCNKDNKNRDCERGFVCGEENRCIPMPDDIFVQRCISKLRENKIEVMQQQDKKFYIQTNNKALPDTLDDFNKMFINPKTGDMRNLNLFKKRVLGLTSYFRSAQEQLMPRFNIDEDLKILQIPMSDYQFGIYETARAAERDMEKNNAKKKKKQSGTDGIYEESVSTYRIFSRAYCNFVFPNEIGRPMPNEKEELKDMVIREGGDELDEDDLDGLKIEERLDNVDGRYDADDESKLKMLASNNNLSTYADRIKSALVQLETNSDEFLTPKALEVYSPKFLEVLRNIKSQTNFGKHLIYSQFRTLEGIGIISLILEKNGFTRFKLKKNDSDEWEVDIAEKDLGKPTFALYTGTEEAEEKELIRNIYNGAWDKIPTKIRDYVSKLAENNNMGEIIKIFMITSSGAEGISLKSTRFVHIIEPYWHPVRIEQVIGRARRICSHNELEDEYKDVKVFIYLMTFADNQMLASELGGLASRDLLIKDVSKIDGKTPLTSDEALWEISNKKQEINRQILDSLKSSSMDCSLHSKSTDANPIVCFPGGEPTPDEFIITPDIQTGATDKDERRNQRKLKVKFESIELGGRKYAFKRSDQKLIGKQPSEGTLYDLESYMVAKKNKGMAPRVVGYLRYDKSTKKLKFSKA